MAIESKRLLVASLTAVMFAAASCEAPGTGEAKKPAAAETAPAGKAAPQAPQGQTPQVPGTIDEQRRAVLVAAYIEDAHKLRSEGKLEAALHQLRKAKDLSPGNTEVHSFIQSINAELGNPAGTATTFGEEQQRLMQIAEERRWSLVLGRLQNAKEAMKEANYSHALDELRLAQLDIEFAPQQDWKDLPKQVQDLKAEAEKQQDTQVRHQQTEFNEKMAASLREQKAAEDARRRAQIDSLLHQGQLAYQGRRFQFAQDLSLRALTLQPNNAIAMELHNAAIKASRDDAKDGYYYEKAKELRAMIEAMEEVKVPQSDVIRLDVATWNRALRRAQTGVAAAPMDPEDQRLWDKVKTEQVGKLTFTTENGQYPDVVRHLSGITGVPIIITPEGRAAVAEESLVLEIELVNSVTLENFLNHMVYNRSTKLGWRVQNGVVLITSKALAGGTNVVHTYDVRDLVFKRTQFLPPRIRDIPGEAGADDSPRTGGEADEKVSFVEMDLLKTTLQESTDPAYWAATDGGAEMTPEEQGFMVVKASPAMHARLATMMNEMRRFATPVVTIDSKFLLITRNFLQEVGVDFRGLGGSGNKGQVVSLDDVTNGLQNNASRGRDNGGTGDPAANPLSGAFYNDGGDGDVRARTENFFTTGLGNVLTPNGGLTAGWTYINDIQFSMILRAIEKQEDAEVVNSQILTVVNNERGHVAVINQTAYIRDFDVEVAQASFIADPKVDVIQDGIVLDVQPIIKHDRKYITMQLQPTVAELQRPIPTFTTSLAGNTQPVTLQMPILTVTSFATTVTVPDGGTVLLGGLRQMLNRERRAEVPLLGKLPLISILFKQEGTVDESRSLMVMVSARITDVRDTEGK